MTKQQYREYFKKIHKYIKFTPIMAKLNIPRTLFSSFLNGDDQAMSIERLSLIKKNIQTLLEAMSSDKNI